MSNNYEYQLEAVYGADTLTRRVVDLRAGPLLQDWYQELKDREWVSLYATWQREITTVLSKT